MERVAIIFSTITGNAFKLASAVSEVVPDYVGPYNIRYVNDEVLEKFDTFILSYLPSTMTACFICIIYCSLRSSSTSSFSRIIFSSVTLILSFLSASFNESRFLRRVFMLILRLS